MSATVQMLPPIHQSKSSLNLCHEPCQWLNSTAAARDFHIVSFSMEGVHPSQDWPVSKSPLTLRRPASCPRVSVSGLQSCHLAFEGMQLCT